MLRRYQAVASVAPSLAIQASLVFSGVLSARLLGPELRGSLTLATLLPGVVAVVATLGLPNAIAYFTSRDRGLAALILARSLGLVIPMIILAELVHVGLFLVLFGADSAEIRAAVLPSLLVVPAILVHLVAAAHLQGLARFRDMTSLRVAPFVLYAIGVSACYVMDLRSLSIVIWMYVFGYGTAAAISVVLLLSALKDAHQGTTTVAPRSMLGFGARGFAVNLSPIEVFRADQLLVGAVLPAASLGYYSVATAFSVFPRLIAQSLGLIASAEVARGTDAQRKAYARGFFNTGMLLVIPTVVVIELLLPMLIPLLFGDAFRPALASTRLLVLAAAALGIRRLVTDLLRGLGHPEGESIAELASWPVLALGSIAVILAGALGGGIEGVACVVLAASTLSLAVALASLARAASASRYAATDFPGA